jgi:hypothetical protein
LQVIPKPSYGGRLPRAAVWQEIKTSEAGLSDNDQPGLEQLARSLTVAAPGGATRRDASRDSGYPMSS